MKTKKQKKEWMVGTDTYLRNDDVYVMVRVRRNVKGSKWSEWACAGRFAKPPETVKQKTIMEEK